MKRDIWRLGAVAIPCVYVPGPQYSHILHPPGEPRTVSQNLVQQRRVILPHDGVPSMTACEDYFVPRKVSHQFQIMSAAEVHAADSRALVRKFSEDMEDDSESEAETPPRNLQRIVQESCRQEQRLIDEEENWRKYFEPWNPTQR